MQNNTVFKSFCIPLAAIAAVESATFILILLTNKSRNAVASFITSTGEAAFIISMSCEDSNPLSEAHSEIAIMKHIRIERIANYIYARKKER